ncbi:aspartyl protease family protein [Flavobacteriaceae bacterium S356]|uniref:Aspartyl protease family protein n=1 Tax=Asprobacillus argus TaxID=3076534 RepID=A0ABU3LGU7_9FLAO|nr:aspartyl protease family protein [Flavobacteriaceae bacterium S356]
MIRSFIKARAYFILGYFMFLSIVQLCAQVSEIPFVLRENGHIHIKVKLNEFDKPLNFVFDTGATADVLDEKLAKKLGLKPNYKQSVAGGGGSKSYDIVLGQKLTIAPKVVIEQSNLVLTNLEPFHQLSDYPFDGIFGYSLLRNYVTKIDYQKEKLLLYEKIEDVDLNKYEKLPFQFGGGIPIPQLEVSIQLKNGEVFSGSILFDSGAGITLSVNSPFKNKNKLSEKSNKRIISKSQNLGHESISEQIAIRSFKIGSFEFNDLTISLSNDKSGVSAYPNYLGILGAKIIKRFSVILDYTQKRLYLKPNTLYTNPFEFPLSGIRLKKDKGTILVGSVAGSSPAYKKGLRKGDKIITIGGVSSSSLSEYYKLLKKEGTTISIKVLSTSEQEKTVQITLQKLL